MPGGKGAMKIGSLHYETDKIYVLGNGKKRPGYSWFKDNQRMARGDGVDSGKKRRNRYFPTVTTNKFSKRQHICGTKPYSFTLADSGYGEPCEIQKPKKRGLKTLEVLNEK